MPTIPQTLAALSRVVSVVMNLSTALVLGNDVLLGAVPMEDIDLTIHSARQRLEPDPRSPNIPHALVK